MDRRTVFPGQLPLETDLLATGQQAMVGLAKLAEATLGTQTVADGFSLVPSQPISLSVVLSAGTIYQQVQIEQSTWSSLPTDTRQIVKQGIALDPQSIPMVPPVTVGYTVAVLIQAQYGDADEDSVVRPYYNAANPAQPFSGPGNSNQAQPTTRKGKVVINSKYGAAAPTGSQQIPTPDPGWIGLYVVTVPYGASAITSGQIAPYYNAPTVLAKLPAVPRAIQNNTWTFVADASSTVNVITGSPVPALQSYSTATELAVLVANTNTDVVSINISGLGSRNLTRRDGSTLQPGDLIRGSVVKIIDDGTQYRLSSLAQGEVARIVQNPVFYVRTDGNDNNDGSANTASKAFATLTAAVLNGTNKLTLAGRTATIVLGIPGTYAAPNFPGIYANAENSLQSSGTLLIEGAGIFGGDTTSTTQGQYIIAGTGYSAATGILHFSFGTQAILRGLKIQNDATVHQSLAATTGSVVYCEYVTFGGSGLSSGAHLYAGDEAVIKTGPGIIIASSAGGVFNASGGGILTKSGPTIAIQGTLNITTFATASGSGGRITAAGATGFTVTGSVTGTRYSANLNGTINSFGGGSTYFPGTIAGSTATGGQYV